MDVTDDVTATLRAEAHHPPCVLESAGFCTEHSSKSRSIGYEEETSPTLRTGVVPAAVALENHPANSRIAISEDNEDVSFTLNTVDRHAVYEMTTGSFTQVAEDKAPTVLARDYKDPTAVCYGIGRDTFNQGKNAKFAPTFEEELQPTLVAKDPGAIQSGYTVRRLTPTECARLQGFPDNWCGDLGTEKPTDEEMHFWHKVFKTYSEVTGCKMKSDKQIAKWLRDPHSDAAEYKMWGNGVALPCVYFVLSGIVWADGSTTK